MPFPDAGDVDGHEPGGRPSPGRDDGLDHLLDLLGRISAELGRSVAFSRCRRLTWNRRRMPICA